MPHHHYQWFISRPSGVPMAVKIISTGQPERSQKERREMKGKTDGRWWPSSFVFGFTSDAPSHLRSSYSISMYGPSHSSEKGGHDSKTYSPDTGLSSKLTERPLIVSYRQLVRGDQPQENQTRKTTAQFK
jgi:hypothetical protein